MPKDRGEDLALVLPGALLLVAFFLPIAQMLVLSVAHEPSGRLSAEHFARFLSDPYFAGVAWRTVRLSLTITLIAAAIGFPLAYIMARVSPTLRLWLIILVVFVLIPIALLFKIPVGRFWRAIKEPWLIAFSTASSEAAFPQAMQAMERFGVFGLFEQNFECAENFWYPVRPIRSRACAAVRRRNRGGRRRRDIDI